MKHIPFEADSAIIYIDTRDQLTYQQGHLKTSLYIPAANLAEYGSSLIPAGSRLALVVAEPDYALMNQYQAIIEQEQLGQFVGFVLFDEIDPEYIIPSETITAQDFLNLTEAYILLDVRKPKEITRIPPEKNLVSIPLADLSGRLNEIDKDLTIYTLCGSGNRGTVSASVLARLGYKTCVVAGGMKAIQDVQADDSPQS